MDLHCSLSAQGRPITDKMIRRLPRSCREAAPDDLCEEPDRSPKIDRSGFTFQSLMARFSGLAQIDPGLSVGYSVFGILASVVVMFGSFTGIGTGSASKVDVTSAGAAQSYVQSTATSRTMEDGLGNAMQIRQITRTTQTGAPIMMLSRAVDELQSNAVRNELTEQLLDELGAAETPERSDVLNKLIWKAWFYHQSAGVADLMEKGETYMNAGKYAEAEWCFRNVCDFDSSYAEAWNRLATLHYLTGDNEQSLIEIRRTLELQPRHFGAISGRGLVLSQMQRYAEAAQSFREVGDIWPSARDSCDRRVDLSMSLERKIIATGIADLGP